MSKKRVRFYKEVNTCDFCGIEVKEITQTDTVYSNPQYTRIKIHNHVSKSGWTYLDFHTACVKKMWELTTAAGKAYKEGKS